MIFVFPKAFDFKILGDRFKSAGAKSLQSGRAHSSRSVNGTPYLFVLSFPLVLGSPVAVNVFQEPYTVTNDQTKPKDGVAEHLFEDIWGDCYEPTAGHTGSSSCLAVDWESEESKYAMAVAAVCG